MLGIVLFVVVDDPPVVVVVDCAKRNPVDSAATAAAKRSCFMMNSVFKHRPFGHVTSQGNDVSKKSGHIDLSICENGRRFLLLKARRR